VCGQQPAPREFEDRGDRQVQELGYLARVENIVAGESWAIWNQSGRVHRLVAEKDSAIYLY
jgi:hypothetical protein